MATTQIDGHRQVKAATITDAEIAGAAAIALSKLAEAVLQADGGQALTGDLPAGGHAITGLADPTNAQDAATKAWVLANAATPTSATGVRAATIANIALSGTQTIDGVALSVADTVLVKDQTLPKNNGLYAVASGAWTRLSIMDAWSEVPGFVVAVEEGTANGDTLWLSTADAGGTLGTTSITFVQLPGPSDVIAGAGLTRTGQTVDAVAGDASILVNANELHVQRSGATLATDGSGLKVASAGITSAELGTDARRVVRETPGGSINGSNVTYTLANTPTSGSEEVYLNGILQEPGAGNDYTISGGTITYLAAPSTGDRLRVSYVH